MSHREIMFQLLTARLAGVACAEPMLIEGDNAPRSPLRAARAR
jgi:hypothetical protein